MAKSSEAFWWSLFGAGGIVAALLMPVTIFITGIAVPFGWISEESFYELIHHPLARLYLFVLIAPSLFHAAHRIRMTLRDLGLKGGVPAFLLYGGAILGSVLAVVFLVQM